MSGTDDSEAFRKGYEAAMRDAGGMSAPPNPPPAPAPVPAVAGPPPAARGGVGSKAGFAIGWVIFFPLAMGTVGGFVGLLLGGIQGFWWGFGAMALLCFAFALFAGAGILVFRYWPIVLGIMVLLWLGSKVLG